MAAGAHRLHDALQRRTVCGHEEGTFVSGQFWYEPAVATLWWDLDLLYQSLRIKCNRLQTKWHWLEEFKDRVDVEIPVRDGELPFLVRETGRCPSASRTARTVYIGRGRGYLGSGMGCIWGRALEFQINRGRQLNILIVLPKNSQI
jgi:hypothetical protein